jgi:hypothetical protein
MTVEQLYSQTNSLSHTEKAVLIDKLILSIAKTDTHLDSLWVSEVEKRLDNYHNTKHSKSLDEIIAKYR